MFESTFRCEQICRPCLEHEIGLPVSQVLHLEARRSSSKSSSNFAMRTLRPCGGRDLVDLHSDFSNLWKSRDILHMLCLAWLQSVVVFIWCENAKKNESETLSRGAKLFSVSPQAGRIKGSSYAAIPFQHKGIAHLSPSHSDWRFCRVRLRPPNQRRRCSL